MPAMRRAGEALPIYPHTNRGGTAREATNEKAVTQGNVTNQIEIAPSN
jgi:hypothetical protein